MEGFIVGLLKIVCTPILTIINILKDEEPASATCQYSPAMWTKYPMLSSSSLELDGLNLKSGPDFT